MTVPPVPLIGIPACAREIGIHPFHVVGDKYMRAVAEAAGGLPLTVPAFGAALDVDTVLDRFDGLLFTGSPSNVEPARYDGPPSANGTLHDPERDATTLPLIRNAIERGIPIFCICRGVQELNVALGGSLHQEVHRVPGRIDHRSDDSQPRDVQYGPAHDVTLAAGGLLASLWPAPEVAVNSLHAQGIDRLAPPLVIEATAPDGQIEAVRVSDASSFALGVQWHPEWKVTDDPFSMAMPSGAGCLPRGRRARGLKRSQFTQKLSSSLSLTAAGRAAPPAQERRAAVAAWRRTDASESPSPRATPAPSPPPRSRVPCTRRGWAPPGACRARPPPEHRAPPRAG